MNDELWYLKQTALLEQLRQLQQADTVAALRQATMALGERLEQADSSLHVAGIDDIETDTLEVHRAYLRSELEQIATAHTLERARYYIGRLIKALTEERTSAINDLNLNRWKEYDDIFTDSLWHVERRDNTGAHTAGYWGNFIPQIPNQMMRRYTRRGEWVLDTFAGMGTALLEGQRLGRNMIGIELQADIAAQARQLIVGEPNPYQVVSEIVTADSTNTDYVNLLARYGQQSVQLVILHPPYFDIIKFSADPRDLSNAATVSRFLAALRALVQRVAPVLDQGRYLVLVIGDKYARGEWTPLGFRAMDEVLNCGFLLKSIVVKNFETTTGKRQQKELWRYRALVSGFYVFKHEYIFIFQKK
jgi:SAM-dependent methyltransferase